MRLESEGELMAVQMGREHEGKAVMISTKGRGKQMVGVMIRLWPMRGHWMWMDLLVLIT